MTRRTLAVVSAGLGQPSSTRMLADRLAGAVRDDLSERAIPVETTVVEVREHAHDIVNHTLTGFPPAALAPALEAVTAADGLIAVTPVFHASASGLFKAFFDVLPDDSLADQPVLVGATGGTPRHSLALEHALRPMFTYLRAAVVPTSVFAAGEDWSGGGVDGALRQRIVRAAGELAREMTRREAREGGADPFALPGDFEELLSGE